MIAWLIDGWSSIKFTRYIFVSMGNSRWLLEQELVISYSLNARTRWTDHLLSGKKYKLIVYHDKNKSYFDGMMMSSLY
jgi:hypothetical protein